MMAGVDELIVEIKYLKESIEKLEKAIQGIDEKMNQSVASIAGACAMRHDGLNMRFEKIADNFVLTDQKIYLAEQELTARALARFELNAGKIQQIEQKLVGVETRMYFICGAATILTSAIITTILRLIFK